MDQPGNSHYAQHTSQQTLNGHSGYYSNGYQAGYQANGYNGQDGQASYGQAAHGQGPGGYPAEVIVPEARPAVEVAGATTAETVLDDTARDAAPGPKATAAPDAATLDAASAANGDAADGAAAQVPGSNSAAERMRELLARSAVDHHAVERATAVALEEIRQRLTGLERVVSEVREYAGAEHDSANRTAEQVSTLAQRMVGMTATLDGLTAGLSTFSAQLSAIDGRLANADSRLAGADVKLASTEGRVTALDTRFERLDERLDDQYDRVTSIDNRLAATDDRITLLGGHVTESLKPLAEDIRARPGRAEVEDLVTKIVKAAHDDISGRLTSLEDTVLTLAEALLRPAPGHIPPNQHTPPDQ
jgi:predicted  nucleic acid-binding Zn-ribbon protein